MGAGRVVVFAGMVAVFGSVGAGQAAAGCNFGSPDPGDCPTAPSPGDPLLCPGARLFLSAPADSVRATYCGGTFRGSGFTSLKVNQEDSFDVAFLPGPSQCTVSFPRNGPFPTGA